MTDRVGKRESGFDVVLFDITPEKTQGAKPPDPQGDAKKAIEKALRDQGAGSYIDGPRLKTRSEVLADVFSKKANPRKPGCAKPREAPVDMGTGSWGSVAKQYAVGLQFTKLEAKHEKLVGRLETSINAWQAAKKTIAKQEKNPAARQQKLAYADAAIGRLRTQLPETRVQFGIVEHEYKVAMGTEKRAAIGPAKAGDKFLSPAELADLKKRTLTLEKRIEMIGNSGLIASVSTFIYVVGTEAGGRSLDARDYRALDTIYAIGALGSSAAPHVDGQHREAGMNLEESTAHEARRAR